MNTSNSAILDVLFLIAPQFITADPVLLAQYNGIINLVRNMVNVQFLSCNAALAFAFLVAHYLTLTTNPNLGVYSNMTEGQLSLGINVAQDMNALNMTPYGRSYIELVNRTTVGSTVTNLPPALGGVATPILGVGCCGPYGLGYGYGLGGGCGC